LYLVFLVVFGTKDSSVSDTTYHILYTIIMKLMYLFLGLLILPAIFFLDIFMFFATKTAVSCLHCELATYMQTTSLSFYVLSNLVSSVRNLVYKKDIK